jgi:alpha-beta hydrolase superfamily lysophospholipase
MDELQLTGADGATLWLYRSLPQQAPRGVVLIVHGLSEHGARYAPLAADLARAGFVVYAYDQRGHGAHAVQTGWIAASAGWALLLSDLDQVRAHVARSHTGLPLVLFGHSMGSLVARAYFLHAGQGLSALILSATSYRQGAGARLMRAIARLCGKLRGPRRPSLFLARLIFGSFNLRFRPRRTAVDWLSRDNAEVDRYLADPLCAFLPTPGLWVDLFDGVIQLERAEKHPLNLPLECPVLLYAGSRDPVSLGNWGLKQLARRYRHAGLRQVETRVYPDGRHEMHNETNREQVLNDLLSWLQRSLPPPAAPGASAEQ